MATKKKPAMTARTVQRMRPPITTKISVAHTMKARSERECDDSCALNAYHAWKSANLPASFNHMISFNIPAGRRFVIELVTASIGVPAGETARLRMFTGLGASPSNVDLFVTPQGFFGGKAQFVATHALRAYTDSLLEFNINRDNGFTTGDVLIAVSGYLV
jgi:hypothetical protein